MAKKKLSQFQKIAKASADKWDAETFCKDFIGKENYEKILNGQRLGFNAFEIWREDAEDGAGPGTLFLKHKDRGGMEGATIEITAKNVERLYFAASVDNHLLADWPYVIYEQSDSEEGRADVALCSADPAKGGKVLAIYENKQASTTGSFDVQSQKEDALRQAISRVERLEKAGKIGETVSLTVCLFDKDSLKLSSAGEYYNNEAQSLGEENRLEQAKQAVETYGMWAESWVVNVEDLLRVQPDKRMWYLTQQNPSACSAPMIPLGAPKGSRSQVDGLDEAAATNTLVWTRFSKMMSYPFLNPSGHSDAQNTRELMDRKARILAPGIALSMIRNFLDWKKAGGSSRSGIPDESFVSLGAGDRELHLVKGACFDAGSGPAALGEGSLYDRIWIGGDIGFANGQHSTKAFSMIRKALDEAAGRKDDSEFAKAFLEADAFNGDGASPKQRQELAAELAAALKARGGAAEELRYFINQTVLRTSIKWARDDRHSWRLSFESNTSVGQDQEDLLIHEHRDQIKDVLRTLSQACQRSGRDNPIVMAKNHNSALAESFGRGHESVQLAEAMQWLAADRMFQQKGWGKVGEDWREGASAYMQSNAERTKEALESLAAASGLTISQDSAESIAKALYGSQAVYKTIFSSTKSEKAKTYREIKRILMKGDDLIGAIRDAADQMAEDFDPKDPVSMKESLQEYAKALQKVAASAFERQIIPKAAKDHFASALGYIIDVKLDSDGGSREIRAEMDALRQEMEKRVNMGGCNPNPLHAAAICARALADFKREACEERQRDQPASKGKKKKDKEMKFSEILSQDKYSFWSKEASFDMLVAAALGKAYGSALAEGQYQIEPEREDGTGWPERLERRVKSAARLTLDKIEILTAAHKEDPSLVSHLFRHGHGAFRLLETLEPEKGGYHMRQSLEKAGVPVSLGAANFYEWIGNAARGLDGNPAPNLDEGALPSQWLDHPVRAEASHATATKRRAAKAKRI